MAYTVTNALSYIGKFGNFIHTNQMIIQRLTTHFYPGAIEQGIALILEELAHTNDYEITPNSVHLYKLQSTESDAIVVDWEFEDLKHADAFWTYWLALPEAAAFSEKFHPLQAKDQESVSLDVVTTWAKP